METTIMDGRNLMDVQPFSKKNTNKEFKEFAQDYTVSMNSLISEKESDESLKTKFYQFGTIQDWGWNQEEMQAYIDLMNGRLTP